MLKTHPAVLPSGTRRRALKASQNQRVPLWTVEPEGQLFQGIIRVPIGLCNTQEHTNERLQFAKLVTENLERWTDWRKMRGWFIAEAPRVSGPFDPPEQKKDYTEQAIAALGRPREVRPVKEFDNGEEFKWYIAEARFTREEPVMVRLDDMLFMRHLALIYGVDPDRDPDPNSYVPDGKDYIEVTGGLDALKVAEERRQRLGLKREDYLFNPLKEPL